MARSTLAAAMELPLFLFVVILLSTVGVVDSSKNKIIKRVGVIISNGFELLDAMGPYETLKEVQEHYYSFVDIKERTWKKEGKSGIQCAHPEGDDRRLDVEVSLASFETKSVTSSSGVSLVPEFDLSLDPEAKQFDLLVLGAGAIDINNSDESQKAIGYLQHHHQRGGLLLTVCTGALYPALVGYLNNVNATTNSLFLEEFRNDFPGVEWVSLADDVHHRFIRSTKQITTSAGITAGIDGTLHQIKDWCGEEVAEATRQCLEWPLDIEATVSSSMSKSSNIRTPILMD